MVGDVKRTEVDSGEVAQALVLRQNATDTLSGGVTLDEVKAMI